MLNLLIFLVAVCALLGGLWPGLLATAVAAGLLSQPGSMPHLSALTGDQSRWIEWVLFVAGGITLSVLAHLQRRDRLACQRSEEWMRAVIDGSSDAIFVKDPQGRQLFASRATATLRLGPDARSGEDPSSHCPATQAALSDAEVISTGKTYVREERRVAANGEGRDFLATKGPVLDCDGRVSGVFEIWRDITANKRADDDLRASEARYRSLFHNMLDGYVHGRMIFRDGKAIDYEFIAVNPAFEQHTGLHNVAGRKMSELVAGGFDAYRETCEVFARVAATGVAKRWEHFLPALEQWFSFAVYRPVEGEFIAILENITERRRAEEDLQSGKELLDRMSRLAKVGGWSFDVATMREVWTDELARIQGRAPPASAKSGSTRSFFHGDAWQRMELALKDSIEQTVPYDEVVELITDDGIRKWVRTQGQPIVRDGKVVRVEGAIQDITEMREAQLALETHQLHLEQLVTERTAELGLARLEAERLARVKTEFLARMSHEIRTPLNSVLGLARIGYRDSDTRSVARDNFGRILDAGSLLLGIVNDILDFSRIEAGKLNVESIPVRLGEVLDRAAELLQERALSKRLELWVEKSADLPAICMTDPLRFEQVLINLVSNAIKFTDVGSVFVSAHKEESIIVVRVSDTGIGIGKEQLARLCQPYEQAERDVARKYGGSGLGLVITRQLVELMGGSLHIESALGVGSTFEVRLPLVLPPSSALMPPSPARPTYGGGQRLTGFAVLAVEDDKVNQLILVDLLEEEGASVTVAGSGREALDCIRSDGGEIFDLVLMDVRMPEMDGFATTRKILELVPDLPILGQTADVRDEVAQQCRAAGMRGHLTKPIDIDELVAAIWRHARLARGKVDWPALEIQYKRRPEFVQRLMDLVLRDHAETPDRLRAAAGKGDREQMRFLAHRVKGVAGGILASEAMALAEAAEGAVRAGQANAAELVNSLADAFERVVMEVARRKAALAAGDAAAGGAAFGLS